MIAVWNYSSNEPFDLGAPKDSEHQQIRAHSGISSSWKLKVNHHLEAESETQEQQRIIRLDVEIIHSL